MHLGISFRGPEPSPFAPSRLPRTSNFEGINKSALRFRGTRRPRRPACSERKKEKKRGGGGIVAFWVRSNFTCCWESHDCLTGRVRDAGLDEHIRHYKINTTLSFDTGRGRQKCKVRSHCTKTHPTPYKKVFDIMPRNSPISVFPHPPEHASAWHFVTPTHRANARFPAPLVAQTLIAHTASSCSTAGLHCLSGSMGPVE